MDDFDKQYGTSSILHQALCIISNPLVNSNWRYSLETLTSSQIWWFLSCMTLEFGGWPWKTIGQLFYTTSSFVHVFTSICECEFKLELQSGNGQFGPKLAIFVLCDLKICWMKNNRAPLLYHVKLCASLQSHRWIQTWVAVPKRPIRVKIGYFLSLVTLKFDGWPWKTIGHLFYTTLSFVHHFTVIGEFKLGLQSGNAQFRSKLAIVLSRVTLKFDIWPWKTTGHLLYAATSFVHHFTAIIEFKLELQSGNT